VHYFSVFKNASYQTFARILTGGSGFIIAILLARSFGTAGYGDFIKVTSFVALFYLFCDFGINAIYLQRDDAQESFKALLSLRFAIAAVFFIVANAVSTILPYNLGVGFSSVVKLGIFIYSFEFFIQSLLFSASAVFQKKLRFDFWTKSLGLGSAVSLLLVSLAVFKGYSLQTTLLFLLLGDLTAAIFAIYYTREKIFPFKLDFKISKELLIGSFPLGLMLIFNLIYFRIDSLILAAFKSSADVGIYGLSYLFFDFLLALPLFISNSIYPILLKEKENKRQFSKLVRSYLPIYLGLSAVLAIPFWFASPLFTLVKPDFSLAIVPFRILLLSLPFFFLTSFLQWILITHSKTGYLLRVYFLSMCANIVLNFIFIPKYSYVAAATITGVLEAIVFLFLIYKVVNLND